MKQRAPSAVLADPWMSRILQGGMFDRNSGWVTTGIRGCKEREIYK